MGSWVSYRSHPGGPDFISEGSSRNIGSGRGHRAVDVTSNIEIEPGRRRGSAAEGACLPEGTTSARLLATILETAVQPFVASTLEGTITGVNPAFAELTGYATTDLVGKSLADITPPHLREAQARAVGKVRSTRKSLRFEGECLRSDGLIVPIDVAAEPDRDSSGAMIGVFAFVTDLTDRKQAEKALRESEERFRRLYDNAPVGYHEVDVNGTIININKTECELLGYSREELIGQSVFRLIVEETRDAAMKAFPEKVSGRRALRTIERTFANREGGRIVVSIQERYRRNEHDEILGILSTVQDVTERNRTELALHASERRARALFEGIEDAVFVHSLEGEILDANPAASRLLGYAHDELVGMHTSQIDEAGFAAGYEERLAQQLALGHLSCEGRHHTKDGRVLPVEVKTSTIQLDDRKAVMAVIRDISERIAFEETRRQFAEAQSRNAREMAVKNTQLTLSEARYRQLTEGCLDGVVVADRLGLVTLFNPACERMFGWEANHVLGKPIELLLPGLTAASPGSCFADAVRDAETGFVGKTVEIDGRQKSGDQFPVELSLSAVERGGELQFIGSLRDQTERQRMRAMLAQSEKLASIGLLSAGVAHEINNPLAYVGNNVAVLERDLASVFEMIALYESAEPVLKNGNPEMFEQLQALTLDFDWEYVRENLPRMLTRTREGIQRVANIVANLRGLARTSPPKMEPASAHDIIESALEMVRGRLRRHHIELEVHYGDVPPLVCVGPQISQVMLNLVMNAAQAIEGNTKAIEGRIVVASILEGSSVVLSVSDNGGGIDPEAIPRLFDPFYTTKGVGEGTGLGLSICHGIVTGHGGRIDVQTRPGVGSCFRIVLPKKGG